MKISLNWLKDYVELPADLSAAQLMADLTMTTVEVEGMDVLADRYQHIVLATISETKPVPDSKKLTQVMCDVGQKQSASIICGACNCAPGMKVAVALPGASVLNRTTGQAFEISQVEMAGLPSEGMICAASELGLSHLFPTTQEKAIIDLSSFDAKSGTELVDVLGMRDVILDIDNKSLTNRPDLWGHYGMARELAAIYDVPFKSIEPAQLDILAKPLVGDVHPDICHRFTAHTIDNIQMVPAPFWMQVRLACIEQKPINVWVDLTNYVMFDVGQPSHAYDADEVSLPFGVRWAQSEETLTLLDDSELTLSDSQPVIIDQERTLALAGIKGGQSSALKDRTEKIVLEMANFHALTVRRSATISGLRTDASARFEKGLDTQRIDLALSRFIDLLSQIQPQAKWQYGCDHFHELTATPTIEVSLAFLQKRLGKTISVEEATKSLKTIGFKVSEQDAQLSIEVPSWRATGDVSEASDIVEEVARFIGYDHFESYSPSIVLDQASMKRVSNTERHIKTFFATHADAQEVLTYPWVDASALDACGYDQQGRLSIPAGPAGESSLLQPTVLPNLLAQVAENTRYFNEFALFATGRVYSGEVAPLNDQQERRAEEHTELACAWLGDDPETLFFKAKGAIEQLSRFAHLPGLTIEPAKTLAWGDDNAQCDLMIDGQCLGHLALLAARTKRLLNIKPQYQVVACMLNLAMWPAFSTRENPYQAISSQPQVDLDLNLVYPREVRWDHIQSALMGSDPLIKAVSWVSTYQGQGIGEDEKSVTLRLALGAEERTLKSKEINKLSDDSIKLLENKFNAVLRA